MPESIALSLREVIFDRIAESDGCYLMIYSGPGEKLPFLSSLFREQKDDFDIRLLIDFNLKQYASFLNCEGCTLIGSLSEKHVDETPESYCLKIVRENIRKFADSRAESGRIVVVVECSLFLSDIQEPLTNGTITFHKDVVNLINSIEGGTGVLLYNVDSLSDKLLSKLLQFHRTSKDAPRTLSLHVLKQELLERTKTSVGSPKILGRDEGILFLDPATDSAAFLVPMTDAIREVLPRDPLDITHRDIAFANNYTACEGACPYLSPDVPSQCLLDPKVVMPEKTRGRSFVEGHPCLPAVDHMIVEERPEMKEKPRQDEDAEGTGDGHSEGSREHPYRTSIDSGRGKGSSFTKNH